MKSGLKMRITLAAALMALSLTLTPRVQAEGPAVSGFIDSTYNYNFNKPSGQTNELRSFDAKDNTFLINAAQLQLTGTLGDAGYVVKFLAGTDAGIITSVGAGAADDFDLEEAYLTYKCPITGLNLKGGKFATPMGIEVIESKDDPTISRGYLFGLAEAYTHTGFILSHAVGKADVGLGLVNGWDVTNDNNKGKTLIGKASYSFGDPLSLTLSALHGPEQANTYNVAFPTASTTLDGNNRTAVDLVAVIKMIPKVTLNVQANIGTERRVIDGNADGNLDRDTWKGAGIQPVIAISEKFSIGSRLEYFYDKLGSRVGTAVAPTSTAFDHLALTNFTITPSLKLTDTTTLRLEYRYDTANKKVFVDDKGTAKDSSSTVSAEWILTF